jgi:hypothetical protein
MTKIPKLLIVLFLVFLSVKGFSRATTAKFTVQQLKEDYRLLLTSLKKLIRVYIVIQPKKNLKTRQS